MRKLDLAGVRFGSLFVVRQSPNRGVKIAWECLCDCGRRAVVTATHLRGGHTASCGCLRDEGSRRSRTHGRTGTAEYWVWAAMLDRCRNPNNPGYRNYGGRGIRVCARWAGKGGFVAFLADMGARPTDGMTINRVNNDGPYSPGNCRWATRVEQANNCRRRRDARTLTIDGEERTIADWARRTGIPYQALYARARRGKRESA